MPPAVEAQTLNHWTAREFPAPPAFVVGQAESRSLGREWWGRNPSALLQKIVPTHTMAFTSSILEAGQGGTRATGRETENRDS